MSALYAGLGENTIKKVNLYPNPVFETTILSYTLKNNETISIDLVDVQGRIIKTFIYRQDRKAGDHQEKFSIDSSIPAGAYFFVISTDERNQRIKMIRL